MLEKSHCVYFIRAPGFIYVGISRQVEHRFSCHRKSIAEARRNPYIYVGRKYHWLSLFEPHEIAWSVFADGLTLDEARFLEGALVREFGQIKRIKVLNTIADDCPGLRSKDRRTARLRHLESLNKKTPKIA